MKTENILAMEKSSENKAVIYGKHEKGFLIKLKKWLPLICLGLFIIILPIIFNAIFNDLKKEVWLGFWASYTGGICTLIAVVITMLFESSNIKKESENLNKKLMLQFERDLDLKRFEKFEDASINFKILILKINPKFEKCDGKIVFNYNQIKDEMYEKYSLFKQYYYSIKIKMDAEAKTHFQKTIKKYISYLDKLKNSDLTDILDAENVLEKINEDYMNECAMSNKHFFLKLRKEVILYIQNKYN